MTARTWLAITAAVSVLVAACGGAATPSPAPATTGPAATSAASAAPATRPPREKITVAIGSAASLIYLQWDLAKALKYFDDENIDADLQYQQAGTQAATALLSGSADFTGNSLDHSIKAQLQGKPTKMVVSFTRLPGVALIVSNRLKDSVKSIKDLKGKKLGATSEGSGTHLLLTYAMLQAGMKQDVDYTFVACGSGTMAAALDSGGADACMNSDPYITAYASANKGFVLTDLRTEKDTTALLGGAYQFTGAVTTQDFIRKKPDVVQRVVNALVRANRYIAANTAKDIAAKLPESVTGKDLDLYLKALDAAKGYYSKDGIIDAKSVDNVLKVNVEDCKANEKLCGNVKPTDKVDTAALFDNSFVQKVR